MSWSGLANNQTVSGDNLNDAINTGVFVVRSGTSVGSKQLTKLEALNAVYASMNTTKTDNQLVVKSDLVAISSPAYYTMSNQVRTLNPLSVVYTASSSFDHIEFINCSPSLQYVLIYNANNGEIVYTYNGFSSITSLPATGITNVKKVFMANNGYQAIVTFYQLYVTYILDPNVWLPSLQVANEASQTLTMCQAGNGSYYFGIRYDSDYGSTLYYANYNNGADPWYASSPAEINGHDFIDCYCSYDGTYQLFVGTSFIPYGGRYVLTQNGGSSFTANILGSSGFSCCCVSDSGQFMIMGNDVGQVFVSTDYGSTFTNTITLTGGGTLIVASVSVNNPGTMWLAVAAYTSKYSYDGVTWSDFNLGSFTYAVAN